MQVREIMSHQVVSISPEESTDLAARLLSRHNLGALPVCTAEGKLRGILTDRDIVLRCVAPGMDPSRTPVRDVMSECVITVAPTDPVARAAQLMANAQVRRLPVAENGVAVGFVSLGDIAAARKCEMEAAAALTEISSNIRHR